MISQRKVSAFLSDEKGGLPSLEFVLLSIPMLIMTFCVVQFMMLAHANIVIKSAAHAAARSAMVHKCQPLDLTSAASNVFGAVADTFFGSCTDKPDEWETAARMALLPIAASSDAAVARGGCDYPEALVKFLQEDAVRTGLEPTLINKACYVFEPGNVAVEVEWETDFGLGVTLLGGPPPVNARVQFKVPLLAPTREIFNSGKRDDNTYYWQGEADVTLL